LVPGKTYTCAVKATNGVGDGPYSGASAPFTVAVPGPHFTVTPNTDLIDGQTVRMHIDGAQPDAEAVLYQCTDAGAVNCDFSGSGFVDSSGQIDFDVEVHSSINGQRCGSACMEFAVTGSGNRTQSLSFRPTTTPAAPTGVNVTPSATSASVAFTPGADGGSAVTSYYARCTSSTGGLTRAMNGPASPLMVTGLTRGSTYTCKARATNATGTGAYSASTGPFVVRDVPLAPAIDGVTPSGTQVEVAFTPGPGGTPATSYTVLCAASGGTARSTSGPASPLVVRALSGGSNYSCQVRGANDMGKGPYSGPSTSFTPGTTVPGKPTSPAQTYSDRVATVTFTPEPDGGSPITSYTAVCTSTTGGASRSRTGAASPLSVQQLTTDQIYRCRVRAANAVGTGQYSPYTALFHT
jgi:titin